MTGALAPALLGRGEVLHTRLAPRRNAFRYPVFFLLLPLRAGFAEHRWFGRNRFAPLAFRDADHGEGQADALAWAESLLARFGIADADGEIWLQTFPRVFGYVFKPVSFWFCHRRRDGALRCVLAEVNNTFGERHVYLLDDPGGGALAWGQELRARKVFHVSPFCRVEGGYRFRFLRTGDAAAGRIVLRVDHDDADGRPLLQTSIHGVLAPLDAACARGALLRQPLMTLGVIARIHVQALRLWAARVPWFSKPPPPALAVTRGAAGVAGTPAFSHQQPLRRLP
jgi:DUF1365 family protein